MAPTANEFNEEVKRAIDGAIFGLVGQGVLQSLYKHLKDHYDITPNDVPMRLGTLFETLEHVFGVTGARTIGKAIARRLYFRFNLQFVDAQDSSLQDYLQQAKKELRLL